MVWLGLESKVAGRKVHTNPEYLIHISTKQLFIYNFPQPGEIFYFDRCQCSRKVIPALPRFKKFSYGNTGERSIDPIVALQFSKLYFNIFSRGDLIGVNWHPSTWYLTSLTCLGPSYYTDLANFNQGMYSPPPFRTNRGHLYEKFRSLGRWRRCIAG